ncbi:hypothetical protein [Alteribacter aurantiacus]|uniref:hypothetical protein n=1 Tax=Alteribacter aurantiacus TaxID=254410 RepID=UPI0012EBC800|nr:hypothetical protein [Alteribacter aurantiacus]
MSTNTSDTDSSGTAEATNTSGVTNTVDPTSTSTVEGNTIDSSITPTNTNENSTTSETGDNTTTNTSNADNSSDNDNGSSADSTLSSTSSACNASDNESQSNNVFDNDSALQNTSYGLASAADNSANTISNGNCFKVGNNTMININDSNISIAILVLLASLFPMINQGFTDSGNGIVSCGSPNTTGTLEANPTTSKNDALKKIETIISTILHEEREKQHKLHDILKSLNSNTDEPDQV